MNGPSEVLGPVKRRYDRLEIRAAVSEGFLVMDTYTLSPNGPAQVLYAGTIQGALRYIHQTLDPASVPYEPGPEVLAALHKDLIR